MAPRTTRRRLPEFDEQDLAIIEAFLTYEGLTTECVQLVAEYTQLPEQEIPRRIRELQNKGVLPETITLRIPPIRLTEVIILVNLTGGLAMLPALDRNIQKWPEVRRRMINEHGKIKLSVLLPDKPLPQAIDEFLDKLRTITEIQHAQVTEIFLDVQENKLSPSLDHLENK